MSHTYRIGADENGLGARLGPMLVTAVLARSEPTASRLFSGELPAALRKDLDDSKQLISHSNYVLGEAWARALVSDRASSPAELLASLSLESAEQLRSPCPEHAEPQCWGSEGEQFSASDELVGRVAEHLEWLSRQGLQVVNVRSSVQCTHRLNQALARGDHRFVVDLHAMERLVLALRESAGEEVLAICGKVGGISNYPKFFGPLAGRLHSTLVQQRQQSAYYFPKLGELRFLRDADATDPLVMLASLVGKYLRELLMARICRYTGGAASGLGLGAISATVSGYHDPVTARFVEATRPARQQLKIVDGCFERIRSNSRRQPNLPS